MNVIVGPDDLDEVYFDGSVYVANGTTEDGGCRITFAGDHRPMRQFLDAVQESGEPQTAEVELWQILRTRPIAGRKR